MGSVTVPDDRNQQLLAQVDRIDHSSAFSGSETLRHLLEFLAGHAVGNPGQPPREKDIALAVFGRAAEFDPQNDSVVRVQTGRLRSKLAEYYVADGAADPLVIEIPRGGYLLSAHFRSAGTATVPAPAAATRKALRLWLAISAAGALAAALAGGYFLGKEHRCPSPARSKP